MKGIVTKVEYFGHDARVELTVRGEGGDIRVVARIAGAALPAEGSTMCVSIEPPLWDRRARRVETRQTAGRSSAISRSLFFRILSRVPSGNSSTT